MPQPSFLLTGPSGFARSSRVGSAIDADREVLLPHPGEYVLLVAPAANRLGTGYLVGGTDYGYVGIIERLPWPTATALEAVLSPDRSLLAGEVFGLAMDGTDFVCYRPAEV